MNNLYLIIGENDTVINLELKNILKDNYDNLITYDMENINISNAIMDLDTYGFFNEKKYVYAKNAKFLSSEKMDINHDVDILKKYIENPNKDNVLIISCNKLDSKKNIVKLVKDKMMVIETEVDLNKYIKNYCKNTKISLDTIKYLIDNIGTDINRINNELDKLLMYSKNEITKSDIDDVVIKKIDTNIFLLIDAIISKDKKKSLTIYHEMINYGEDIFKIMIALANQIRLIYSVKVLENFANDEITSILNLKNPKQVVALRYKIKNYSRKDLLNYLHRLSLLDEDLKLGKCIDEIAFPTFIMSL